MKKAISFILLIILMLSGCSNVRLSGESKNWEGEYIETKDATSKDGTYIFHYKKGDSNTILENLEIVINDGEINRKDESHKGATIQFSSSCQGCAVSNSEPEPIKVKISWGENNEETFYLK
jgi:major membrane immunogen (membrane-anchored lipoprotein)